MFSVINLWLSEYCIIPWRWSIDSAIGFYQYKKIKTKEDDLVYYQTHNGKAWFGPVKVFTIQGIYFWIITHGDTRKIPRCNIKFCRKM